MTGNFTDWNGNVAELGPLYPFVGWEFLMVIILLVVWIWWHIAQVRMENVKHAADAATMRQTGALQKAIAEEHTIERM